MLEEEESVQEEEETDHVREVIELEVEEEHDVVTGGGGDRVQ